VLTYVLKRVLATLPVMLMVAALVFALLRLTPGDPAAMLLGDDASAEQLAAVRERMGLDRPLFEQLLTWFANLARGDLGQSLLSGKPVLEMIGSRMGPTVSLAITTITFTVIVAVPMGIIAARRPGGMVDRAIMAVSVMGFSLPTFVVGYILILVMALQLRLLPVQGYVPLDKGFWPYIERLILPTLALSGVYIALVARITRSAIIDQMREDYIRTARAKGATERTVLMRHALNNAAVPIVTVIGLGVAGMITGVVVTESVFNLPGLGRLVVEAVLARDYPIIQGLILLFSFSYIVINLIVDLLYTVFDPRIRY